MKSLQTTDETSVTWKKSYCWINVDIWGFRFSRLHMHIAYTGICVCTCRLQNQRYICCFRLADLLSRVWLFGVTISPFRDFCQLRIFGLESKQIGKEKAKSKEKKSRNGDTLGPVELIVWPEQGNQGDQRRQSPSHYLFFLSDVTIRYYCETSRLV